MLTALLMLSSNAYAQSPQKTSTLSVAGHSGEAQLLQLNGKSYIEIEALARLTQGTLSFKVDGATLTLPALNPEVKESAPAAKVVLSTAFIQASVEELSVIRDWRAAIVKAVQENTPVADEWVSAHHRLAEKNLALALAAASTEDDRSASPMLSVEFNNMQKLSESYLTMRKQIEFISPQEFGNAALEEQILTCAQGFASMTEKREFRDQPACH
jgi:hypothetical protein